MKVTLSDVTYDISSSPSMRNLYYKYIDDVNNIIKDVAPLPPTINYFVDRLADEHYLHKGSKNGVYYIRQELQKPFMEIESERTRSKIIVKMAILDAIIHGQNPVVNTLCKYVFIKDKYLKYRHLSQFTFDRIDQCICGSDTSHKTKNRDIMSLKHFRHYGTYTGQKIYRKLGANATPDDIEEYWRNVNKIESIMNSLFG